MSEETEFSPIQASDLASPPERPGPAPALPASAGTAEDALRLLVQSGETDSAYPLWTHLSANAHREFERELARLDLADLELFSLPDLALLIQWLFAQHDIETVDVVERDGGLDLSLFNLRLRQEEYARVFRVAAPPELFHDLSEMLEGRDIARVRLCTLGAFSDEQWKVQKEFPSFLEFWDRAALVRYLHEAQLVYNSPRIQSRRALPARKAAAPSARRRPKTAPAARLDPARLKSQFGALTRSRFLSERLLTAAVAVTGLAFALSLLTLGPDATATPTLGAAVLVASVLRLYTGFRRGRRARQLWSLLNSSSDAFEAGMPYVFRMAGYQVEKVHRYQSRMDSERTGSRGIVAVLRRRRRRLVAYCASPRLALTAMDIGVCDSEMEKHQTAEGMVVIRGVFSLGAIQRAGLDRITLVDGRALRKWLR